MEEDFVDGGVARGMGMVRSGSRCEGGGLRVGKLG